MLDELLQNTFDLDYKIYTAMNSKFKNYLTQFEQPKLKSDDILKEFENYVRTSKIIFSECNALLNECNKQRHNMRTILVKMSKDKMLVQKFFKDDDNSLILSKLQLHDELKTVTNERNLNIIANLNKTIFGLQNQLAYKKVTDSLSKNNPTVNPKNYHGNEKIKTNIFGNKGSKISNANTLTNKNLIVEKKLNNKVHSKYSNSRANINSDTKNSTMSENSNKNKKKTEETILNNDFKFMDIQSDEFFTKNVLNLNLDFNTEKYNIISSSPIMTPQENKTKTKAMTNFKLNGKSCNTKTHTNNLNNITYSHKLSDDREDIKTERERPKKICCMNSHGKHMRNFSFHNNKHFSANYLSETNFKKFDKKVEKKSLLNDNDIRNVETNTNFTNYTNYTNFNDSNEKNLNQSNHRIKMLNSISKSIDFDGDYLNENFLQSKRNLIENAIDDPNCDLLSYRASNTQTPNMNQNRNEPKFSFNEERRDTEYFKKEKSPEFIKIQRRKRNSMTELMFTNFVNKYNILNTQTNLNRENSFKGEIGDKNLVKTYKNSGTGAILNKKTSVKTVNNNILNKKTSPRSTKTKINIRDSVKSYNTNTGGNIDNSPFTQSNTKAKNSIKSFNTGYKEGRTSLKI